MLTNMMEFTNLLSLGIIKEIKKKIVQDHLKFLLKKSKIEYLKKYKKNNKIIDLFIISEIISGIICFAFCSNKNKAELYLSNMVL